MPASRDSGPPRTAPRSQAESTARGLQSALPAAVFGSPETGVEDALLAAAQQVFLRHMAATNERHPAKTATAPPPAGAQTGDDMSCEELRACVDAILGLGPIDPPDLLAGLQHERVWILLHMARHGTGLCRQRATQELRATLRAVSARPAEHRELLAALADRLAEHDDHAGSAALFRALLHEVREALAQASLDDEVPR